MIDPKTLDAWFTYHAPTEATAPKYAAIRDGEKACRVAIVDVLHNYTMRPPDAYAAINAATRTFADVINEQAPDSADKTAAIRCLRLARNAANEVIALRAEHGLKMAASLVAMVDSFDGYAMEQILAARWQANAAVALDGK